MSSTIKRAARIAGVSISKMMDILHEHNVTMNLQHEDTLRGLDSLKGFFAALGDLWNQYVYKQQ